MSETTHQLRLASELQPGDWFCVPHMKNRQGIVEWTIWEFIERSPDLNRLWSRCIHKGRGHWRKGKALWLHIKPDGIVGVYTDPEKVVLRDDVVEYRKKRSEKSTQDVHNLLGGMADRLKSQGYVK